MTQQDLVPAIDFCKTHDLEFSFILNLEQYGLVEITTVEEVRYLHFSQLERAERIARLYTDLGINLEGIDAIGHLLGRVEQMQREISHLRNRLTLYEGES